MTFRHVIFSFCVLVFLVFLLMFADPDPDGRELSVVGGIADAEEVEVEPAGTSPHPPADEVSSPGGSEPPRSAPIPMASVAGIVSVIDPSSLEEYSALDGSFRLRVEQGGGLPSFQSVTVSAGTWNASVPVGSTIRISDLVMGGRSAFGPPTTTEIDSSTDLAITAYWSSRAVVRVVDASDRRDLVSVSIRRATIVDRAEGRIGPGVSAATVVRGESPFPMPSSEHGEQFYWAGSDGYAWQLFVIDYTYHRDGQEVVVELVPEAKVHVFVSTAHALPSDTSIRFYDMDREDPRPVYEHPAESEIRIAGLPEGSFDVRLERGHWANEPMHLASERSELREGHETRVELHPDQASPCFAHVSGSVVVPESWPPDLGFAIQFVPIWADEPMAIVDSAELVPGQHGEFHWKGAKLPCGRTLIVIPELAYVHEFDVIGSEPHSVVVQVPQAARVEVSVTDVDSGSPVPLRFVRWRPHGTPHALRLNRVEDTSGVPGRASFWAPVGEIELSIATTPSAGFQPDIKQVHDVSAGINHIAIEIPRLTGFVLVGLSGNREIDLTGFVSSGSFRILATHVDGTGEGRSSGFALVDGRLCVLVTEGGTYEFAVSGPAGYTVEQSRPLRAFVADGTTSKLTLELSIDR